MKILTKFGGDPAGVYKPGYHRQSISQAVEQLLVHMPGEEFLVVDVGEPHVNHTADSMQSMLAKYCVRPESTPCQAGHQGQVLFPDNLPLHEEAEAARRARNRARVPDSGAGRSLSLIHI